VAELDEKKREELERERASLLSGTCPLRARGTGITIVLSRSAPAAMGNCKGSSRRLQAEQSERGVGCDDTSYFLFGIVTRGQEGARIESGVAVELLAVCESARRHSHSLRSTKDISNGKNSNVDHESIKRKGLPSVVALHSR